MFFYDVSRSTTGSLGAEGCAHVLESVFRQGVSLDRSDVVKKAV
jgi:hypothetical protein